MQVLSRTCYTEEGQDSLRTDVLPELTESVGILFLFSAISRYEKEPQDVIHVQPVPNLKYNSSGTCLTL